MSSLLLTVLMIFVIVVFTEYIWRAKLLRNEHARKLVHILVGTYAAFWGFYLSTNQILLLAAAMLTVVMVSRTFSIFRSIHAVQRKTWGELFFPATIALCALLTDSPWIFMAALLHVSIADGLAAVIGTKYIRSHGYKIFGHQKTIVGTLVFLISSVLIILATVLFAPDLQVTNLVFLLAPFIATLAENIGFYGTDDLLVPLSIVAALQLG